MSTMLSFDQKTKVVNKVSFARPGPASDGALTKRAAHRLAGRTPLQLRPGGGIAIKRNVHEVETDVAPAALAEALHQLLCQPGARFGALRLLRPAHRVGQAFCAGDRFQGTFDAAALLAGGGWIKRQLAWLLSRPLGRLTRWWEGRFLSDWGEVVDVQLTPDERGVRRFQYVYLSGSPIAGSSTYLIHPTAAGSRLEQVFHFQEEGGTAISGVHRFGLKAHDRVLLAQMEQALEITGGTLLSTTIHRTR